MTAFSTTFRTENTIFHVAIGIATLLLSVLGFIIAHEYKTLPALARNTLHIADVIEHIRYLDEHLTMSATTAVYTGDSNGAWRERYNTSAVALDKYLAQAMIAERSARGDTALTDAVSASNSALIILEEQAFRLLEAGDKSAAINVLEDDDYIARKKRYASTLNALYTALQEVTLKNTDAVERAATFKAGVFAMSFLLLLFTWFTAIFLLKRSRKALSAQYTLLETIVEHMPLAMYSKNIADGRASYLRFNKEAERFFGVSRNHVLNRKDADIFPHEKCKRSHADAAVTTDPVITEQEHINSACGPRIARTVRIPVLERGAPHTLLVFIHDITRDIQSAEQLKSYAEHLESRTAELVSATETAEQALRTKALFLANMSHELRTPLHAIRNYADMGARRLDSEAEPKIAKYLGNITIGATRLSKLLDDLLDLSKMEAGKTVFRIRRTSIFDTVEEMYEEMSPLIAQKNLEFVVSHYGDLKTAPMDKTRIIQALINIVSNAVRYSPEGAKITLETGITEDHRCVFFRVTDEGPGIPHGEEEAIFESFAQSSTTADGSGGTGLGLSICRNIAGAHKGNISARNRTDGQCGCVFEMTLPAIGDTHHKDVHYAII